MSETPNGSSKQVTYIWGVMLPVSVAVIMCVFSAVRDLRFTFGAVACAMIVLAVALRRARRSAAIQLLLWVTAAVAISAVFSVGSHIRP